jgi:serine/threonine protein kinase
MWQSKWHKWKTSKIHLKSEHFTFGSEINTGTFSKVVSAKRHGKFKKVAIKILTKNTCNTQSIIDLEIGIHSKLKHKNIIKYMGSYQDDNNFYIVLEYIKGLDLYEYIQSLSEKRLSTNTAIKYAKDIIEAIMYCHSKNVIHRDIKPENILIDKKTNIAKLIDFGLARDFDSNEFNCSGTLLYMAPEVINNQRQDKMIDIWAMGLVIYEMLTGTASFTGRHTDDTDDICRNILACTIFYPKYVTNTAIDLISKMVVINPSKRLELENVLKHPWFTQTTK